MQGQRLPYGGAGMTLSTDIYIRSTEAGPSQDEVFDQLNVILGTPPREKRQILDEAEDTSIWPERRDQRSLSNRIGQGFAAIIDTRARFDFGPMVGSHRTEADDPGDACEADCDYSAHIVPKHHIHADLDTAYGYRDDRGFGCTELHALTIVELDAWLKREFPGARLWWVDEYRDALHEGTSEESMTEFLGGGEKAAAWFQSSVRPVLEQMGAVL